jgi:hypothetical protein
MCSNEGDRTAAMAILLAAALLCVGIATTACAKKPAGVAPTPGMTYDSLKSLPDFSGWWHFEIAPDRAIADFTDAPLQPKAAAFLKDQVARLNSGKLTDRVATGEEKPTVYCTPPQYSGFNGGVDADVEFLFTPGRVTIADEGGLVRRVYLSDRPLPDDVDEMNSGTSVGHWEGQTLVVETSGLNSHTRWTGPFTIGHNVHVTERISLKGPDQLEIAMRMTAPELFTRPYEKKYTYRREPGHAFHEALSCVDDDRSVDPKTGKQRFDLTPPKDLPPPPPG